MTWLRVIRIARKLIDLAVALFLVLLGVSMVLMVTGCATTETAPQGVQAVAEAPCDPAKAPKPRPLPADSLTGAEDLFTWGTTMWADYLARRAYQRELEAFVEECTKPSGSS